MMRLWIYYLYRKLTTLDYTRPCVLLNYYLVATHEVYLKQCGVLINANITFIFDKKYLMCDWILHIIFSSIEDSFLIQIII